MTPEEKLENILSSQASGVTSLCRDLVRIPSEDPPGDTREIASYIFDYCMKSGLDCEIIAPHPEKPNVVASVKGDLPGPHIVFNGHMDTFPVGDRSKWHFDPFGGEEVKGRLYGRGAADMKGGLAACIYSVVLLNKIKRYLPGKVSVTCVSDEEVFGPWGTKYLLENRPELRGDALINGEPSSLENIRIGEKGQYWFRFSSRTEGGHGAYASLKPSAIRNMIAFLEDLENLPPELSAVPKPTEDMMNEARCCFDRLLCEGATEAALKASMNVGKIEGGLSVNMVPEHCVAEVDFRLPPGVPADTLREWVAKTLHKHPTCSSVEFDSQDAFLTPPSNLLVQIAKHTAEEILGISVPVAYSLGGTEARMWRKCGVPAITYGPNHHNMGSPDEYIEVAELVNVLKVHVLTALRFCLANSSNETWGVTSHDGVPMSKNQLHYLFITMTNKPF